MRAHSAGLRLGLGALVAGCSTTAQLRLENGSTVSGVVMESAEESPDSSGEAPIEIRSEDVAEVELPGKAPIRAGAGLLAVGVTGLLVGTLFAIEPWGGSCDDDCNIHLITAGFMYAAAVPFLAVGGGLLGWGRARRNRAREIMQGESFFLDPAPPSKAKLWAAYLGVSAVVIGGGALLGSGLEQRRSLRRSSYFGPRRYQRSRRRLGTGATVLGLGLAGIVGVVAWHRRGAGSFVQLTVAPSRHGFALAVVGEFR